MQFPHLPLARVRDRPSRADPTLALLPPPADFWVVGQQKCGTSSFVLNLVDVSGACVLSYGQLGKPQGSRQYGWPRVASTNSGDPLLRLHTQRGLRAPALHAACARCPR